MSVACPTGGSTHVFRQVNAAALHPNGYPVITQCRRFINFTIPTLKDQSLYNEFREEPSSVPHNRKEPTAHQYAI